VTLTHNKTLFSLSIDRIDNKVGHITSNVQLVCMGINLARNRGSIQDISRFVNCIRGQLFEPERPSRDYISTCIRNATTKSLRRGFDCELTTDYVLGCYLANNRCALTGIPMAAYRAGCLSLSLDRIDSNGPYSIANVRLVCRGINLARGIRPDNEVITWLEAIRRK
jgi:hypothetical protein